MIDPEKSVFLRDVVAGLSRRPRAIPCKYFYDARGSELFDAITRLPEYYPTVTEIGILERFGSEIAESIGPEAVLIELGSGSSVKVRILLDHLPTLAAYVPVDISEDYLIASAADLGRDFPDLTILPVAADYSREIILPDLPPHRHKVAFFPGSTIGNLPPEQAATFLARLAGFLGDQGGLVIGVDLPKERAVLERAYDDEAGVTADFNLNLLHRINRELEGTFEPDRFAHRAVWNERASRMEIYLVSLEDQTASVAGHRFAFSEGEAIHTENSYKYDVASFVELARQAGFVHARTWLDDGERFSVHYMQTA